jgi:hypothetical protein
MQTWEIVLIVIAALAVCAAIGWTLYERQRSRRLKVHFGKEYDRTVAEVGNRRRAESNLRHREDRVSKLAIQPLRDSDRQRYLTDWAVCQSHFVDDPVDAVYQADELILAIMRSRGYPAHDVLERFEDISAAYPWVASDYRRAREIVAHHRAGNATTEEMRQAMVHFRKIFNELLEEGKHEEYKRAS